MNVIIFLEMNIVPVYIFTDQRAYCSVNLIPGGDMENLDGEFELNIDACTCRSRQAEFL